jgi:leucyl-tRNA synthetase
VKDGAKMSKSRGNVIVPDDLIARWGADAVRLYLMFLGPYQEGGDFRAAGLTGPAGFLSRLWDSVAACEARALAPEVERKLHATIGKVTADLEALSYNTAIAAMMEYLNVVRAGGRVPERDALAPLVLLVAPFAPHLAEELHERLGGEGSVFDGARWPEHDPALAVADTVELVVQVGGRVRARLTVPRGTTEDAARAAAVADPAVLRWLEGKAVRRAIFVPDRLLNLVVG